MDEVRRNLAVTARTRRVNDNTRGQQQSACSVRSEAVYEATESFYEEEEKEETTQQEEKGEVHDEENRQHVFRMKAIELLRLRALLSRTTEESSIAPQVCDRIMREKNKKQKTKADHSQWREGVTHRHRIFIRSVICCPSYTIDTMILLSCNRDRASNSTTAAVLV